MKLLPPILLSLALTSSAPISDDEKLVIYTAEHDIVKIVVPINHIQDHATITLFFVEADIKDDGTKEYKGLFVLDGKNATKLLDNGRDAAAPIGDSKQVFLGANDGLYIYNVEKNTADKYGSITDSIIALAKLNGSDAFYILTEDKILFKVTDNGNKKEAIDAVQNAEQMVLDYSDNLYYVNVEKQLYVMTAEGVRKIDGLPETPTEVTLITPPVTSSNCAFAIIEGNTFVIYSNGTSKSTDKIKGKPTALAIEAALIQYMAYNKKIYELNFISFMLEDIFRKLRNGLQIF